MKINNIGVNAVNPYKRQAQKLDAAEQTKKQSADQLQISSVAKELQSSTYATERSERIQQLKVDIETGNYKVDANKVASDLLAFYRK
ncbi:MAG: flagellar biosynthesis anti-sigma factor FlgM [Paenisporosarcina sp.]